MTYLFLATTVASVIALFLSSRHPIFGPLQGSAIHPFNLVGFFLLVINFNFSYIWNIVATGGAVYFGDYAISDVDSVLRGFLFFTLMCISVAIGAAAATIRPTRRHTSPLFPTASDKAVAKVVLLVGLIAAVVTTGLVVKASLSYGSLFYIGGMRQIFFRENPLLLMTSTILVPAYILYAGANVERRQRLLMMLTLCAVVILPLGARSRIFYLLIVACTAVVAGGFKVSVAFLYASTPVTLAALVGMRYLREAFGRLSLMDYLKLHGSQLFFGGTEFSQAQPMILAVNTPIVERLPFESFLGMLLAFVPRRIVPWKPEGASTHFTRMAAPDRWNTSQSELVVTGFSNLQYEFGVLGCACAVIILSYLWSRYLVRTAGSNRRDDMVVAFSVASITAYIFVRGDLYLLAFFLWPYAFVLGVRKAVIVARDVMDVLRLPPPDERGSNLPVSG